MSICAIWGAPQSGKTTLAINLSYAISRGDMSVCLISPVAYGELAAKLGIEISEERSLSAAIKGAVGIKQAVSKVNELFYVLASPITADAYDSYYTDEQVKSLLELARETFDFVIVDCPSEHNNLVAAWSLNKADNVAFTTGGKISCFAWYSANRKAVQSVQHKAIQISVETTPDFDYEAMYQLMECTPDLRIPYVREAPFLENEGRYLYEQPGRRGWTFAKAINKLYEVIAL